MNVVTTALPGVLLLEPECFEDGRGFFLESWNRARHERIGLPGEPVQDNHSRSWRNVLRGLHYQVRFPQGKLVSVSHGAVFDVAVDLRRSSATFGRWIGHVLSVENHHQLWVPAGFAHGFLVLSDVADVQYKCTEYRVADDERALRWDDPDIGIDWPLEPGVTPRLAPRDATAARLADAETYA